MEERITYTFERYELKYVMTYKQKEKLVSAMKDRMQPDEFSERSVRSLYFDTPDRRIIRNSMDADSYKEKLRVRSYGAAASDKTVYIELKRKLNGLVYKRRVGMTENEATDYILGGEPSERTQITREIDYFLSFYKNLEPSVLITCDRTAFFSKNGGGYRITFDENILWREQKLSLSENVYGETLLAPETVLVELKTPNVVPVWFSKFLTENGIQKTSFSKYGMAYAASLEKKGTRSIYSA